MGLQDEEWFKFSGLPDARLVDRRKRTEVPGPLGKYYELVFCVNCGSGGSAVTKEWAPFIFYLCDACSTRWGKISLPEIPEAWVR